MSSMKAGGAVHIANLILFIVATFPLLLLSFALFRGGLLDTSAREQRMLGAICLVGGAICAGFNLPFLRRAHRLGWLRRDGVCPHCGYDLGWRHAPRGVPGPTHDAERRATHNPGCPECGWNRGGG